MIIVEDNKLIVYPRISQSTVVAANTFEMKTIKDKLQVGGKVFVVSGGNLLYEPKKEFLSEIIAFFNPRAYTVNILKRGTEYVINNNTIRLGRKTVMFNGTLISSIEDIKRLLIPDIPTERDAILVSPEKYDYPPLGNIYPEPSNEWMVFPKKYSFNGKTNVYTIETPEGAKHIPILPVFVKIYNDFEIDYHISSALEGYYKENVVVDFEVETAVPGYTVKTKHGLVFYQNPDYWCTFVNGAYYEKHKDFYVIRRKDTRGFGDYVWVTKEGEYYVHPRLPTGQTPLYARFFDGKVRLYGIVTPEGMFVIDIQEKRLEKPEPISVFEKNVKLIGTFFVFPFVVKFSESEVVLSQYKDKITIKIDDVLLGDLNRKVIDFKDGAKTLMAAGISPSEKDIIMNYGLTF